MDQRVENLVKECTARALQEIGRPAEVTSATAIYGRRAALDSTQLVSLIVDVEDAVQRAFGVEIVLADERAMSQTRSPFADVATLAAYIETLLNERNHA